MASSAAPSAVAPTSTSAVAPTSTSVAAPELGDLAGRGLEVARLDVGDRNLLVAVAASADARGRGLMGVRDLGDLDGMLFTWGGDTVGAAFTMRNTLIPLDIAFFDTSGRLVDRLRMEPCEAEPCPSYQASGPYAFALETPAGDLSWLGPEDTLSIKQGPKAADD